MKKLPKKKIAEIRKLVLTMKYTDVAEIVGCCATTVMHYARRFGLLDKRYRGKYKNLADVVKQYWGTNTLTEIAEMVGCKPSTVSSCVASQGIVRTKEQKKEIERIRIEKVTDTNRMLAQSDKRRIRFGLEPKTKWFASLAPKRVLAATYRLHHKFGYEYTDDPFTMSRNGNTIKTNRKHNDEAYYSEKYGLKFID